MPTPTSRPQTHSRPTRWRPAHLLGVALVLLVGTTLLGGCGSSSSGTNADPAGVTPSSAALYASVTIKPSGGATGPAMTSIKDLTHLAEPYGSVAQALLSSETSKPQFKHEIEPWVGTRAGIFISSLGTSGLTQGASSTQSLLEGGLSGAVSSLGAGTFDTNGTQGAIVLDTSNLSAARSFLNTRAHEQQAHSATYRGVSYQITPDGTAEGIVDRFAVIGSESGLKSVIDTSLGAQAITSAPGYSKPPAEAIASVYMRPEQFANQTHGSSNTGGQVISLLSKLFAGAQTASLSVTPTSNSISLQGEIHSPSSSTPLFSQEGAQALGKLPGGAWLAAGVGSVNSNLSRDLALLRGIGSLGASSIFATLGGANIEKLLEKLSEPSAKLQQTFGDWAGPAGIYVSGSGLFNLEAALVIASKEPSASRAAVGELANQMRRAGAIVANASIPGTDAAVSVKLQGFPAVLFIADGQGKFVIGLGQASVQGALAPSSTLSTSSAYSTASATLGGGIEPSLIVEFPTLLGFLEGIGLTQSPTLSSIVPYLKSLGTLTAGAVNRSGVEHFRLVLGLANG